MEQLKACIEGKFEALPMKVFHRTFRDFLERCLEYLDVQGEEQFEEMKK